IDAQAEVQPVVDDVLGQVEVRVEDVVAGDPADLDALDRADARFADGMLVEPLEVLGAEHPRRMATDVEARKGDSTGEEAHATLRGSREEEPSSVIGARRSGVQVFSLQWGRERGDESVRRTHSARAVATIRAFGAVRESRTQLDASPRETADGPPHLAPLPD